MIKDSLFPDPLITGIYAKDTAKACNNEMLKAFRDIESSDTLILKMLHAQFLYPQVV